MLTAEIKKFAQGNTDFYTAFCDAFNHREEVKFGRKIGDYDHTVSLDVKEEKVQNAFFAEIERVSSFKRAEDNINFWTSNPMVRSAFFAIVDATIAAILPSFIDSSIGLYTSMKYLPAGDVAKFRLKPNRLMVVSKGGRGERTTFRQKNFDQDVVLAPQEHIITVYADMYNVLAGKESILDYVRLAVLSIEVDMNREAYGALVAGMADNAYPTQFAYTGAFDATRLVTMAERLQAYNMGVKPVVIGTRTAMMKVLPDSTMGYRLNVAGKDGQVDIVKDFYGIDLMVLPQIATGSSDYGLLLDPNTLYMVSPGLDSLVKGVVSNQLSNGNQFYDNADLTQNQTFRRDYNFMFASAALGGRYTITD